MLEFLPLLRKVSSNVLLNLLKFQLWCASSRYFLSPNLFYSAGLLRPTYLIQVERGLEVDQAVSVQVHWNDLRRKTVLLPPQLLGIFHAAKVNAGASS